jgi:predicted phage tail protein
MGLTVMMNKIHDLTGAGGGGGGGGQQPRAPVEDEDTLQSKAFVSLLDLVGEGEIGGLVNGARGIFVDGTPLENADGSRNFAGVTVDSRNGTQGQTPMDGFSDIASPVAVGVKVTTVISYTFSVSNPNADSVRVIMSIPALASIDVSTGDTHGSAVSYQILVSTNGGPFAVFSSPTITGKTRSKYQRSHLITLPKPGTAWAIKVVRLTPDSVTSNLVNETWVDSYTEIVNSKLSYPNSALVSVRIDSSQFSRLPQRSYLVDGLYIRVPQNYNPVTRAYSGIWDGTFKLAVSDNPAWVMYDVLTNARYGLGVFIEQNQVNKAELYQIGKYCDGLVDDGFGGTEPRFRINTSIQTQAEAFKLVSDLSSVFRGMAFWSGSQVGFTQDSPVDPTMIYSPANVINSDFQYSGTSRKDRHSAVLVTWNDASNYFKQQVEYVEDAELIAQFGVKKLEVIAFGCTSRGQANRVGRWILYTERHESNFVTFSVGIDSALVVPGDVVKVHDPIRAGKRLAGRVASATLTSVTLDAPVVLVAPGALVSMRLDDGSFVDRTVVQGAGAFAELTFPSLTTAPSPGAMFIVTEPNLKPMLARVVGISEVPGKFGEYQISAVEHSPAKFDSIDFGLVLDTPVISNIAAAALAPTGVQVTESTYVISPTTPDALAIRLDISWTSLETRFELAWRKTNDGVTTPWEVVTTSANSAEILEAKSGFYEFELVAKPWIGMKSTTVKFSHTLASDEILPNMVANLRLVGGAWTSPDCAIQWDAAANVAEYEVEVWHGTDMIRVEYVKSLGYTYSFEVMKRNNALWRNLVFKVRSISPVNGLKSTPAELVAFNPQLSALLNCVLTPGILLIKFSCDRPIDSDWGGIEVYASKTSGFVPGPTNLVYSGGETAVELSLAPMLSSEEWYVKAFGFDVFGKDSVTWSTQISAFPKSVGDGLIPGEIIGANIAAGALTAEKLKTKRHQIY